MGLASHQNTIRLMSPVADPFARPPQQAAIFMDSTMATKKCGTCGVEKEINDYNFRSRVSTYKKTFGEIWYWKRCRDCCNRLSEVQRGKKKTYSDYKQTEYNKKSRLKDPLKNKARSLVSYAIRSGKILKKVCEVCGNTDVQAHHDDYRKPLHVRWLCVTHHNEHHRNLRYVS